LPSIFLPENIVRIEYYCPILFQLLFSTKALKQIFFVSIGSDFSA